MSAAITGSVVVAGSTGNLGTRLVAALRSRDARVVARVRPGASEEKVAKLRALGAEIAPVDLTSSASVAKACEGAAVVVSSLQGLRDVIVGAQSVLLDGAVAATFLASLAA